MIALALLVLLLLCAPVPAWSACATSSARLEEDLPASWGHQRFADAVTVRALLDLWPADRRRRLPQPDAVTVYRPPEARMVLWFEQRGCIVGWIALEPRKVTRVLERVMGVVA